MLNFKSGKEYEFYFSKNDSITFVCRSIIGDCTTMSLKDEKLADKYKNYCFELYDDVIILLICLVIGNPIVGVLE